MMETNIINKLNVLDGALDIKVIRHSGEDNYVYAVKPSIDAQRQFYEQTMLNPSDSDIPVFNNYWQFDENKGIKGSSTFLALRMDKTALRPNKLWIPGLLEANVFEKRGFGNDVYRTYGLVVYNDDKPNRQISEVLVPQAKELGLKLPLIVPFRDLDYNPDKKKDSGIELFFVEVPKGIISGKKAVEQINSLDITSNSGVHRDITSNSGVHRLYCGRHGIWVAICTNLDGSGDGGRMDWVCGEAPRADLEIAHKALIGRKYGESIKELQREQKEKLSNFEESLSC